MDAPVNAFEAVKARKSDRVLTEVFVEREGLKTLDLNIEPFRWYATLQTAGKGFEAVVKRVNVEQLDRMRNGLGIGTRLSANPDADALDNERKAKQRAKRLIRLYCKQIGVDHLLTLTTREEKNDSEIMLKRFRKFVQLYRVAVGYWEYVAVLEPHPSNPAHLHIHVACVGRINVKLARKIWCAILETDGLTMAGPGNVDAKYIKCNTTNPHGITYKIAAYISKYVSKDSAVAFNKKRYWASRVVMEESKRYLLSARTLEEAMSEFTDRFGVECKHGGGVVGMFCFPYRDGFWMEVVPGLIDYECPF